MSTQSTPSRVPHTRVLTHLDAELEPALRDPEVEHAVVAHGLGLVEHPLVLGQHLWRRPRSVSTPSTLELP
jgi:hypothetical protein